MNDPKQRPSLLEPESRGGDTAEGGFTFQDNMLISRIPKWLSQECFWEMIREALGDGEAKFFSPRVGETREFVEFKNHQVTSSQFWSEIDRFWNLDKGAPGLYTRFVLVCRGVSAPVGRVLNAIRRIRDAFPFYSKCGKEIQESSLQDLISTVKKLGRSKDKAIFLFSQVWIESEAQDAYDLGLEIFRTELIKSFPECGNLAGNVLEYSYYSLKNLLKEKRNKPIARAELENALWSDIPDDIRADKTPVKTLITTKKSKEDKINKEILFEWGEFFGEGREYPPADEWIRLLDELLATRSWIESVRKSNRIALSGIYRISWALSFGYVFSAVAGYNIDMEYRGKRWSTDDFGSACYKWDEKTIGSSQSDEIAVSIGILRDIQQDVNDFLAKQRDSVSLQLILNSKKPILSSTEALIAVHEAKLALIRTLTIKKARVVHLFMAVPAHFALFFGHHLNATGIIQLYEWSFSGNYMPSIRFTT